MRIISSFDKEDLASRFSIYLKQMGIENLCEMQNNAFVVWVYNEDEIEAAKICLEEFQKDPADFRFDVFLSEDNNKRVDDNFEKQLLEEISLRIPKKKFKGKLTALFVFLCFVVYLFNAIEESQLKKTVPYSDFCLTPIEYYLFFEAPYTNNDIANIFKKYDITTEKKLPKGLVKELNKTMTPAWPGIYNIALSKLAHKYLPVKSVFNDIFKKWQLWRLITPAFLHRDFLHILFNMIWLWLLGRQIEERLSSLKYLTLIISLAIFTNVLQYLVSGPYFMGFSGVIMGMAGFVWMRQKIANWEGYNFSKGTYYFLIFYVFSMLLLQIVSFVLSWISIKFPVNIANTAHIAGVVLGLLLGRSSLFAWRVLEH
jgi:GlpG protein